jgi:hypothetical protein
VLRFLPLLPLSSSRVWTYGVPSLPLLPLSPPACESTVTTVTTAFLCCLVPLSRSRILFESCAGCVGGRAVRGGAHPLHRVRARDFPKVVGRRYRAPPSSRSLGFQGRRRGHQAGTARRYAS